MSDDQIAKLYDLIRDFFDNMERRLDEVASQSSMNDLTEKLENIQKTPDLVFFE